MEKKGFRNKIWCFFKRISDTARSWEDILAVQVSEIHLPQEKWRFRIDSSFFWYCLGYRQILGSYPGTPGVRNTSSLRKLCSKVESETPRLFLKNPEGLRSYSVRPGVQNTSSSRKMSVERKFYCYRCCLEYRQVLKWHPGGHGMQNISSSRKMSVELKFDFFIVSRTSIGPAKTSW